jgi:hypothetical protein
MKVKKLSTIHLRDPQKPYQDGYNESIDSVWDIPEKTAQMDNFPLGPNPPDPHGKLFTPELSSLKTAGMVEEVKDARVYKNPVKAQLRAVLAEAKKDVLQGTKYHEAPENKLRLLKHKEDIYVWNGYHVIHSDVIHQLFLTGQSLGTELRLSKVEEVLDQGLRAIYSRAYDDYRQVYNLWDDGSLHYAKTASWFKDVPILYGELRGMSASVFKNPSSKELRECSYKGPPLEVGAWLHGADIFTWDRYGVLHNEVASAIGANSAFLPLFISYDSSGAYVMVTDASRRTKWDENPKTKEYILNHPMMKRLFPRIEEVSYWNEDVVGLWDEKGKKASVVNALVASLKKVAKDIETIEGDSSGSEVKAYRNPSFSLLKKLQGGVDFFRAVLDKQSGDVWVWDGYQVIHSKAARGLGVVSSLRLELSVYNGKVDVSYFDHGLGEKDQGIINENPYFKSLPGFRFVKSIASLKEDKVSKRMSKLADILPVMSPHNHPARPDAGAYPHRAEEEDHEAGMTLHTPPSMRPSRKENLITLGDPDISSDPDISGDTDVKHDPDMIMSFLSTNHRALSSPDMQGKMREYRDLRQEVQKVENKVRSQGGDKDSPWSLEVKKSDKYKRLLGKLSELEAELQGYGMQRYQLQKLATTVEPNEENETPEHLLQRKTMNFK